MQITAFLCNVDACDEDRFLPFLDHKRVSRLGYSFHLPIRPRAPALYVGCDGISDVLASRDTAGRKHYKSDLYTYLYT